MKKMYKQPIVETTEMMPGSIMQTSPGAGISGGGSTGGIGGGTDPIPGE